MRKRTAVLLFACSAALIATVTLVRAADLPTPNGSGAASFADRFPDGTVPRTEASVQHMYCPNPGESCRILYLNPQEEKMLMQQNGILDTAAQGRSLDLGQFAVYLKTRIANSPLGETRPVQAPVPQADPSKDK